MEGGESFRPAEMHLVPVNVTTWGPLVFANLDGKAPPITDMMEDIPRHENGVHHFHSLLHEFLT